VSNREKIIATAYGRLNRPELERLQDAFDTSSLLRAVDKVDELALTLLGDDGVKEMTLRLHGMMNTVLNGAGLTVIAEDETLPELACDLTLELQEMMGTLLGLVKLVEPLMKLSPDD
jgi:hypothetical protein